VLSHQQLPQPLGAEDQSHAADEAEDAVEAERPCKFRMNLLLEVEPAVEQVEREDQAAQQVQPPDDTVDVARLVEPVARRLGRLRQVVLVHDLAARDYFEVTDDRNW